MQEEGLSIPKAAKRCGVPQSTAYELMDLWNPGTGTVLPTKPKNTRGRPPKLKKEHTKQIIQLTDKNPCILRNKPKLNWKKS
jgi:transposase